MIHHLLTVILYTHRKSSITSLQDLLQLLQFLCTLKFAVFLLNALESYFYFIKEFHLFVYCKFKKKVILKSSVAYELKLF